METVSTRIPITGFGITTCLGQGADAHWTRIATGSSGLGPITRFDVSDCGTRLGGEAPGEGIEVAGPGEPLEVRQLAAACLEALEAAGFADGRLPRERRAALVVGSSLAGSSTGERFFRDYLSRGPAACDYSVLGGYFVEAHLAALCHRFGIRGPSVLVSNACAAGATSLARGASLIKLGRADVVLCAGFDPLSVFTFAGFGSLMALSQGAVLPFARDRDGMLLGDGYAAVVLEAGEAAGRRTLAHLSGHGESADAHHLTHPHPDGAGAALAMRRALRMAGLAPDEIDYVNCHGTATRPNDSAEARALRAVFGDRLARLPVSSSKPFFGHTLGGAGTVEAVVTLLAMERGVLPPTPNAAAVDPALAPLDVVPRSRPALIRHAMSNSFGFGGSNGSLVFSRWEAVA